MEYCSNCGALVHETAKSCYHCGLGLTHLNPDRGIYRHPPLDPRARLVRAGKGLLVVLVAMLVLVCVSLLGRFLR